MADRSHASITITGAFRNFEDVEEFCEALAAEGCMTDEHGRIDEDNALEVLRDAVVAGVPLDAYRHEAASGTLDDLETACRSFGLAYARTTDPDMGIDAETVIWNVGDAEPLSYEGRGHPNVKADEVLAALEGDDAARDAMLAKVRRVLGLDLPKALTAAPEIVAEMERRIETATDATP